VIKFLRRSPVEASETASPFLNELEIPQPEASESVDSRLLAKQALGKIEILQNRARKVRLIHTATEIEADWAAFVLVGLLGDPIEEIRGIAVRALIAREDCPLEDVCALLARPPWFAKSAALQILAAKKVPWTARCLRVVIDDPNADVRRSAAAALGEIGGAEARALLVRLGKDSSSYVRSAAQSALDKICDFKFT
jgi:hypothetical protein